MQPTPKMSARALRDPEFVRECARAGYAADPADDFDEVDVAHANGVLVGEERYFGHAFRDAVLTRAAELMASEAPRVPIMPESEREESAREDRRLANGVAYWASVDASHRVREAYFAASPEVQADVRRVLGLA